MVEGLDQAAGRVQGWLYHLAQDAPERAQPGLEESITQLFSNGSALAEGAVSRVLGAASQIIVTLPDTFVFLGTAVVSSFMISAQLPRLRPFLLGSCRQPGPSGSCRCCRTCGSTWVDGFGHSASSWASRSCC